MTMTPKRMELSLKLLDQLIQRAQQEDNEFKARMIAIHQASRGTGDSWMLFHLKTLKDLLLDENPKASYNS